MRLEAGTDLDFLSALVHGRRSRLAEGSRLDELCRLRTVAELVQAIAPEMHGSAVAGLQRRLVSNLAKELANVADYLGDDRGARVVEWLGARLQAENLKVLARGVATGTPLAELQEFIVPLATPFAIDLEGLAGSDSVETFIGRVPSAPLRNGLQAAAPVYDRSRKSFFLEAGLDKGYLVELLERVGRVRQGEGLKQLADQETDMFHLALAARGRLLYGLKAEDLALFHVEGAKVSPGVFGAMLAATSAGALASLAATRVIDPLPKCAGDKPPRYSSAGVYPPRAAEGPAQPDGGLTPAALEVLALERFHRIANRTFRRTPVGLDVVAAYVALKRIELANLITLSEGIRAAAAPEAIRRRLIPRQAGGASGV
ncbi:MAG: V-type ATPase subunit [Planctomycetota bacterium]|nr:V-type ATPase subunit [Planctomycetota bacterium]